jgi:hypothetical protein
MSRKFGPAAQIKICLRCGSKYKLYTSKRGWCHPCVVEDRNTKRPFEDLGLVAKKLRLIEEHGYLCNICSINKWNDQPIILELDHIDGNSDNNTRENLRLLCPNCHSQTPTYRGKNKKAGSARHSKRAQAMIRWAEKLKIEKS